MAVTVKHIFSNAIVDGTNDSVVRPSDWNSAHAITAQMLDRLGVSDAGNTIGDTGLTYGSLYLQGGNNITLSQITAAGSKATVIFSGANAGGVQTGISGVVVSDATYTSGTVSFSNQNNITIGSSVNGATQYIRLSVGNYLTTAMASNRATDFVAATAGFNGTSASGTIASNSISISIGPYITTGGLSGDTTKYVQNWKLTGNTAGTTSSAQGTDLWFQGGNSITVSGSSNSVVFSVGAYLTTADLSANTSKFVQNWKLTGNTAGTTSSAQGTDLWLQGGNSITVSGSSNSVVFSVGAYLTTADLSANTSKFVQNWKLTGNTAGTTSSAQGTDLWFDGGQGITVSGNSNTVKLSVGSYITTADLSANSSKYVQNWKLTGNTAGTTSSAQGTDLWFDGGNSITVSGNSNTVKFSVGAYITTADLSANSSKYFQNWKLTGNTAGTTSSAQGTDLWFQGGQAITVSGSSNSIVISAPQSSSLVGTSGISLSSNGSTVSIYQPVVSEWAPFREAPVTNSTLGLSTLYFVPFDVDDMVSASRVNFFHSIAFTYSGAPQTGSAANLAAGYGLYTRMTGTGTDRISLLTSYSMQYVSGAVSSSTRLSVTNYWQLSNGTTHSTTQYGVQNLTAGTYLTSSIGGYRVLAFPISSLLTPGRYWMGYSVQSASLGNSFVLGHSVLQAQFSNNLPYRPFNVTTQASDAGSWFQGSVGAGIYSAQSAGWPVSIPLTSDSIRQGLIITVPIFNFSGISQSAGIL